jgi:hypothetical protein
MTTNNYPGVVKDIRKRLNSWDFSKAKERAKTGETASREDLINDFLAILGFKRENDDLRYEYSITVKEKKRKADIVILDGKAKSPLVIIECKRSDETLTVKHLDQLILYMAALPESKMGILTNGLDYQFYLKDNEGSNTTPFIEFNIEAIDDLTLQKLAVFHRNNFNFNELKAIADEFYFVEKFENALAEEFATPSTDVLKSLYRKMDGKRFDEKTALRMRELFNSFSLQAAVDKLRESESRNSKLGIVTTQEELKAYSVIRTILATSGKLKAGDIDRISYRDFKGHFSIIVDDSQNKSICTLVLTGKKSIRIGTQNRDLEEPIEISLSQYRKDIIESTLEYLRK